MTPTSSDTSPTLKTMLSLWVSQKEKVGTSVGLEPLPMELTAMVNSFLSENVEAALLTNSVMQSGKPSLATLIVYSRLRRSYGLRQALFALPTSNAGETTNLNTSV